MASVSDFVKTDLCVAVTATLKKTNWHDPLASMGSHVEGYELLWDIIFLQCYPRISDAIPEVILRCYCIIKLIIKKKPNIQKP